MQAISAQHPPPEAGDDRVFTSQGVAVVLDGATAFAPVPVPPARYADTLGRCLLRHHAKNPTADLRDSLRAAIRHTANELGLRPGISPSSTVSIVRDSGRTVDVLVLGDSPVILAVGEEMLKISDERVSGLDLPEQVTYRSRLASGAGYDDRHRATLVALQKHQAKYRNRQNGYWIAEADPDAASHAIYRQFASESLRWAVMATDGAAEPMSHLALDNWPSVAEMDNAELRDLLVRCQHWEECVDPDGVLHPRPKRHDDKTLAVLRFDR
jgi:hypothetical protein